MASAIPLKSLAIGVLWDQALGEAVQLANDRQVFVFLRGTQTQVQVYSNKLLSLPLAQPLLTGGDGTVGALPGYIAAEQAIDVFDVESGVTAQAEPLAVNDVIGTDGLIGGPSSLGVSAAGTAATVVAAGNFTATYVLAVTHAHTWLFGTLNANCAMTITGLAAGYTVQVFPAQDTTGNWTLTINGTGVVIPTRANQTGAITIRYDGTHLYISSVSAVVV